MMHVTKAASSRIMPRVLASLPGNVPSLLSVRNSSSTSKTNEDTRAFIRRSLKKVGTIPEGAFWSVMELLQQDAVSSYLKVSNMIEAKTEKKAIEECWDFAQHHLWHNRVNIAKAFREKRMYALELDVSDDELRIQFQPLRPFCAEMITLSSFYIQDAAGNMAMIWTDPVLRGCGCGSALVKHFNVKKASIYDEESSGFWNKIGVPFEIVKPNFPITTSQRMKKWSDKE